MTTKRKPVLLTKQQDDALRSLGWYQMHGDPSALWWPPDGAPRINLGDGSPDSTVRAAKRLAKHALTRLDKLQPTRRPTRRTP